MQADVNILGPLRYDLCRTCRWRNRRYPAWLLVGATYPNFDAISHRYADKFWGFIDSRHQMAKIMSWYCITLSRQEYESGEMAVLMGTFRAAYVARNGPEGMAMFGCWTDDGTRYLVYTTPRSVRHIAPLLDAYSANRIDMPDPACLSWIYGDESGFSSFEIGFEA